MRCVYREVVKINFITSIRANSSRGAAQASVCGKKDELYEWLNDIYGHELSAEVVRSATQEGARDMLWRNSGFDEDREGMTHKESLKTTIGDIELATTHAMSERKSGNTSSAEVVLVPYYQPAYVAAREAVSLLQSSINLHSLGPEG